MIMTAELNSHQRVSYYTGVKLIRHHQSASTANPNNSTNSNNGNNAPANNSTSGAFYHQHHNHYPPHPPHHHHHNHQQHPPPLPPHHPGHFHLPCPTGPPHIQHPGGVLHLNNHHGPPHHPSHNGPHHYGGGGSNQTTRLYTGSPLIRSTAYHSSSSATTGSGGGIGGLGNSKRSFKSHQNRNNHVFHNNHHTNGRNGGIGNPSHYHNPNIIGGSCSSGSSSSSSSNEHLNSIQSPTSSPLTQAKLDISPLKLSSSPTLNGELSSSNNSSPGPQGSPSPSTASNLSTSSSSSPNSTDGNKDLDHFYFLDEHWKPSSDGNNNTTGIGISSADMLDMNSSNNCARWSSSNSGSPSPLTVASTSATTLTMMVDQFFANGHNNNFGSVDGNNNFIGINRDGLGGGLVLRDSNNNIIGGQQPDFNEIHTRNDRYHNSFSSSSGFSSGNNNVNGSGSEGASGLFNFGGGAKFNGIHSSSSTATTVVNVETQIGTFNGQRDLEIRLCFIKGDHHSKVHRGYGGNHQSQIDTQYPTTLMRNAGSCGENDGKPITAIGDPFKSSKPEQTELQGSLSSTDNEMENKGVTIPMHNKNKEIAQQS